MFNIKKGIILILMVACILFTLATIYSATSPATTWYLFNTAVSGVTPAGQILQSTKSGTTGWQPTKTITTTAAYWYSDTQTGTYTAGNWQFILWTNAPASASTVQVSIYKTNADGSGATQIGSSQQLDVKATGGGNHPSTYNYNGVAAVSLSGQRLMVKIVKISGADATMCYNTNDFPTRLLTPAISTGPTPTPGPTPTSGPTATPTPTPTPGPTATPTPTTPPSGKVIPGQIEAESYNAMSGVQTEATSDTGGGLNVGWIDLNDWMDYNVTVNSTSSYRIDYRVASPNATGKVDFRVNSVTLASTTIPNTGGWQAWTTVSANVSLSAGARTIRLLASGGGWNLNWFSGTIAGPTPTPGPTATPAPTPTTGPTPTPGGAFWDRSGIPVAQNVMIYKFLNRTYGQYTDSQIYWTFNGTTKTIAQQNYIDMPANSAGRVYVSVGAPANPANPDAYWDFIEHTISATTWYGNTTRVDAWGLPLAILLHCHDGYDMALGDDEWLFTTNRSTIFSTYQSTVPAEFQQTATLHAPYRIMAPGSCPVFQSGGTYASYYTAYATQCGYSGLTTQQIFGCSGPMGSNPTAAAALNRHTAHLPTGDQQNPANFYLAAPANYYAKFWHTHGLSGLAYGFPYDDVAGQAAYTAHANPEYLLIAIGF